MKRILIAPVVLFSIGFAQSVTFGGLIGNDVLIGTGGRFPDVAYSSTNGSYLVVWADYSQNPIRAVGRRVDSGGATIGSQFNINDGVSYGLMPAIAYNATNNEWLVTWDDGRGGVDHTYGQRVRGSDGVLLGSNFAIGSIGGGVRSAPSWSSTYNTYLVVFSNYAEVYGQRVSNTGVLLGSNFNISNDAVFSALPAIAGNGAQYLVTWDHNPSGNLAYIRGCLVDASNGALFGSPFNLSSSTADDRSCIAYDSVNGRYLVQWNHQSPGNSYDQYAQFVSTAGTLIGSPIAILNTTDFEGDTQFGGDICFAPGVNRFFSQGANVGSFAGYAGIEFNNATGAVVGYKNILGLGDLMSGNCAADTTLNRYLSCWDGPGIHIRLYGSSATAVPGAASSPNPANGATGVNVNADLIWTAGSGATSHNVYFGTTNPPNYVITTTSTSYDPGTLAVTTTYYWRINEVNAGGTTQGSVWSFTTSGAQTSVDINLGFTNIENLMTSPIGGDGDTVGASGIGGHECRRNMDPTFNDFYFYFTVSDTWAFQGSKQDVWIYCEYYDDATTGSISLNYDAVSSAYKDGGTVYLTGTNTWKTQKWHVTDAYFGNRENNGGDFRIYVGNVVRYLDNHTVNQNTPSTTPPGQASNPSPANGATGVSTTPTLTWTAGANTTTNNVFFGTSNPPPFVVGQASTSYAPGTLTSGTTYYWRIDEYRTGGGTTNGIVWSFTTLGLPGQASNPNPANGATGVSITSSLSWTAGSGATSHDVRFGTVNPPPFVINQTATAYTPATMTPNTVYYWRIDEKNGAGTTTGIVWSFTTLPLPGAASNPSPANGATSVDINTDLSWTAGSNATSHDVRFGTANPPPFVINQTATTYDPGAMAAGTTYYWRIDEKNTSGTTIGTVWSFTTLPLPGQAGSPSPANGATSVSITATLSWTAGSNATSHDVLFGTANPPPFIQNQAGTTYNPGTLAAGTTYFWRIDEKNSSGTTMGTVWSFTTLPLPGLASAPSPANGAAGVSITSTLGWTAGSNATSHDVYFGTSNPPSFVQNQAGTTYNPGALIGNTIYYWRIDEKNASGTTTGTVWSFTTTFCYADSFAYANGNLNGNGGWSGSATSEIQIVSQTVKFNGGAGSKDAIHTTSCTASGTGYIQVAAKIQAGTGISTMWSLWLDDPAGINICRWYGTGTTARGRIGGSASVTPAQTLTGGWDALLVKINPTAKTAEFFFNGVSIGVLDYTAQGAASTLGRVRLERVDNSGAAGNFVSIDDVVVY